MLVPIDLTDAASVQRGVDEMLSTYGRLDAVVTSAQVVAYGTVEQIPSEVFDQVVNTAIRCAPSPASGASPAAGPSAAG